ncbi:MAG: NifB/NifX family molybdenum-iron cluster-binding protein [Bacilli bacterium]|nr:NifB/NifX family molybdenum-iron cluster-binding protein [Bacilli bacterium]
MKIAIASSQGQATSHFGYCEGFVCLTIENKEILNREWIENPGHQPGFLPKFLNEKGINCVICGGMGKSAIDLFTQYHIQVITGVTGTIDSIISDFMNEKLIITKTPCVEHQHGC